MSKRQTLVAKAQNESETSHLLEQKPAHPNEQAPTHQVAQHDAYERTQLNPIGLTAADLRALQPVVGNRMVQRMVARRIDDGDDLPLSVPAEENFTQYAHLTPQGPLPAGRSTRVIQKQQSDSSSLQDIPAELRQSVNLTLLSETHLHQRYDLITSTLMSLQQSLPETIILEEEAGRIGVELARRRDLRTFTPEAINRMRTYFTDNATSPNPESCIDTLNAGIRLLLNQQTQPVGGEIQTTMAHLQKSGRAESARTIEFNAKEDKTTSGVLRPETLRQSVWDAIIKMVGGDPGWSVFGLSLMDGYHSVTLSLDNSDPSKPHVYWSDQSSSRLGWQEFDRSGLDAEITRLTQKWWDEWGTDKDKEKDKHKGTKPKTKVTLWRLRQGNP